MQYILELEGRLGNGVALEALVQPVNGLYGTFAFISKGLRKLMKVMANTLASQSDAPTKAPRPARRRWVVKAAPSREEEARQQEAIPLGLMEQEGNCTTAVPAIVTSGPLPRVLVRSPLNTPAPTSTLKRRTCAPGIEENVKDALEIIVEMPVI
jgi:hypothetical protein